MASAEASGQQGRRRLEGCLETCPCPDSGSSISIFLGTAWHSIVDAASGGRWRGTRSQAAPPRHTYYGSPPPSPLIFTPQLDLLTVSRSWAGRANCMKRGVEWAIASLAEKIAGYCLNTLDAICDSGGNGTMKALEYSWSDTRWANQQARALVRDVQQTTPCSPSMHDVGAREPRLSTRAMKLTFCAAAACRPHTTFFFALFFPD